MKHLVLFGDADNSSYEDYLLANYYTNIKAFFPLAYDDQDYSSIGNHAYTRSGLQFTGPSPLGFQRRQCGYFDGSSSQIRLENTSYPFGLSRWTIACWFKKTGAGTTTSTAGGADGFPSSDPVLPLVTKGRGEAEGSNVDCNWFFGINKVSNGATYKLAGDFEQTNATAGGNNRIVGATALSDNTWYFGVFSFDGANMKLYLNGVLETTTACVNTPRSDSIQKAGIGTAYTSTSVAGGFFAGNICGVGIWSEALSATAIANLYAKGSRIFRTEKTIVVDAPDNQIIHGTNFANWTIDGTSTKGSGGVTVGGGSSAWVSVTGLSANTTYWGRVDISAKSATPGNLFVTNVDGFTAADGSSTVPLGSTLVGTEPLYFKIRTTATASPHLLKITHTGAGGSESIQFSDLRIFTVPERSPAKVIHFGDKTGGYNAANAEIVHAAILDSNADAINAVSTGDLADTTNAHTINDTLKSGINARGGAIYPILGNHDWDAARETEFITYFPEAQALNPGKYYWNTRLGNMEFFGCSNYTDDTDGMPYTGTASAAQITAQGKYILKKINDSTAPWKICMIHYATYSSSAAYGAWTYGRWQWPGLGVPLILQAHVHGIERLEEQTTVEGATKKTTFFTVAKGGNDHHGWTTKRTGPVDFTRFRVESTTLEGYLKFYDGADTLVIEYYDTAQNLKDRIKYTQS